MAFFELAVLPSGPCESSGPRMRQPMQRGICPCPATTAAELWQAGFFE